VSGGRFTFRLERLLALRLMAERAAAISLGSAQAVATAAHAARTLIAGRRAGARAAMLPEPGAERSVAELRQAAFLTEQIDRHLAHASRSTSTADQHARDAHERLDERVTERRILERLRERHHSEWSVDAERREREAADGIARPAATTGAMAPVVRPDR
jgi:flagellar export protein FliJ